ncbi:MAG: hypothetical protein JXQ75_22440 [Phycisphaerae bacterium]|nr:hypothetical protein [Phycisphaerae bacterium]
MARYVHTTISMEEPFGIAGEFIILTFLLDSTGKQTDERNAGRPGFSWHVFWWRNLQRREGSTHRVPGNGFATEQEACNAAKTEIESLLTTENHGPVFLFTS